MQQGLRKQGVHEIDEFIFYNDGEFDGSIMHSIIFKVSLQLKGLPEIFKEIILETIYGKYFEVSGTVALNEVNSRSVGVTTKYFNKDGFMDVVMIQYEEPDIVMYGRGDGTFRRQEAGIWRHDHVKGYHAAAV